MVSSFGISGFYCLSPGGVLVVILVEAVLAVVVVVVLFYHSLGIYALALSSALRFGSAQLFEADADVRAREGLEECT